MKFHGIKMLGKIFAQIVTDVSAISWNSGHLSNIVLDQATGSLFYGDPSTNSFRTLNDIPRSSIFLFESDTTVDGYSLLTTVDDAVVFITSGSGAGGESGGSAKLNGSWSMGAHSHGLASHTHSVASHYHTMAHTHSLNAHRHQWLDYVSAGATYSWNAAGSEITLQSYGTTQTSTGPAINEDNTTMYAAAGDFWTNYASVASGQPSTNNTGAAAISTGGPSTTTDSQPASTSWRPKGRNVTRQQRV